MSIEIPDWVAKVAEEARVNCLSAVTAYGSAGVDERYHMAMKAALRAALEGWLVPTAYYCPHDPDSASAFAWTPSVCDEGDHKPLLREPLYTLRKDKTP